MVGREEWVALGVMAAILCTMAVVVGTIFYQEKFEPRETKSFEGHIVDINVGAGLSQHVQLVFNDAATMLVGYRDAGIFKDKMLLLNRDYIITLEKINFLHTSDWYLKSLELVGGVM